MTITDIPSHFASIAPVDVDSAGFLQQMAALVPGIIYVFNHQSMSNEYANRSIGEMLGYTPDEIKEMGEALLPNIVHPDDFDDLVDHVGALQELEDEQQVSFEYRALRRDGEVVWLRSIERVFTRSATGTVLRHIGIAFDITAEKTAQMQLKDLNTALEARASQGGAA
jgi:PAS domain S-box-containing protein